MCSIYRLGRRHSTRLEQLHSWMIYSLLNIMPPYIWAHIEELRVCAVFFGCIVQISQHTAPFRTIPAWLSHVRNSDRYKEVRLSRRKDLAHTFVQRLGQRIDYGLRFEVRKQGFGGST
ncbi:uncharacterized protein TrAFT101_006616 [Trichoderma asperellum]|uniref:uncharacterized protein n=1 Tax=Trichoderma asperellum TaxID=101201 RepID=UPI0033316EF0|nr:hypothetical protein TrAFT101_006616 [Trichoderma asperellum]